MKEKGIKKEEQLSINFKTLKYIIISLVIIVALGVAYCYHFIKEYNNAVKVEVEENNTSINTTK